MKRHRQISRLDLEKKLYVEDVERKIIISVSTLNSLAK